MRCTFRQSNRFVMNFKERVMFAVNGATEPNNSPLLRFVETECHKSCVILAGSRSGSHRIY